MTLWPHQSRGIAEIIKAIEAGERRLCVSSPTGGGKSRIAIETILWARERGWNAALYTTRKLLTDQLIVVLESAGVRFGVRAAGYDAWTDHAAPVQICSSPTEHRRVFQARKKSMMDESESRAAFRLFDAQLVILDELHMQKAGTVQQIVNEHHECGAAIIGLTATPVGVSHIANKLIMAGTKAELRSYSPPALVPALTFSCPEIDTSKIKRDSTTGEFNQAQLRKIYRTHIYANVVEEMRRLNPDGRPTLVFWPGVQESIHGARVFNEAGIPSAHIDGEDIEVDGERFRSDQDVRESVLRRHRTGQLTAIHNRWVLREGIDLPYVQHLVLATPVGGIVAYTQIVGRVLRYHESHDHVTIQDHGGNWYRHPSPNADIDWAMFYELPERVVSDWHHRQQMQRLRDKKELEFPCEHCGKVLRKMTLPCPTCGKLTKRRGRMVIQHDGKLRHMDGDPVRVPKVYDRADVLKRWDSAYWRCRNSGRTAAQARGLFIHQCIEDRVGYYEPPMGLPNMPRDPLDWYRKLEDLPTDAVISRAEYEAKRERQTA